MSDEAKKNDGWFLPFAFFGGILLVIMTLAQCGGDDTADDADQGPKESDKYLVQITCEDIIKDQLKNPSTADFSDQEQSLSSASGTVVAENSFGGKVTYTYRCSASGDQVRLESLLQR